jgi:hypothetical protein
MTATEIAGLAGAGLAGAAYVPQISHLVRAHCSAGISPLAFAAWLLASVLTTAHAVAIGAAVFVVLGGIQIVATTLIMLCAARYQDKPCPGHSPAPPRANTGTVGRATPVQVFRYQPRPRIVVAGPAATLRDRAKSRQCTEAKTTQLKGTT